MILALLTRLFGRTHVPPLDVAATANAIQAHRLRMPSELILVVDGSSESMEPLLQLLVAAGHRVASLPTVDAILEARTSMTFDRAFVDLQSSATPLPRLASVLRDGLSEPHWPRVVALGRPVDAKGEALALAMGADFWVKPLSGDAFLAALESSSATGDSSIEDHLTLMRGIGDATAVREFIQSCADGIRAESGALASGKGTPAEQAEHVHCLKNLYLSCGFRRAADDCEALMAALKQRTLDDDELAAFAMTAKAALDELSREPEYQE